MVSPTFTCNSDFTNGLYERLEAIRTPASLPNPDPRSPEAENQQWVGSLINDIDEIHASVTASSSIPANHSIS
jgi:hypothetical protein